MIKIETTSDRIESQGGMYFAGTIAQKIGLTTINGNDSCTANTLCSLFASMIQGNTGFEAVKLVKGNPFYSESFALDLNYSETTTRLYFNKLAEKKSSEGMKSKLSQTSYKILKMASISGIRIGKETYLPVDGDTSPMDNSKTKKEGVSYTYKGFSGYQPMMLYVGAEGYMLECELRPGSQHCQKGTPEMLKRQKNNVRELAGGRPVLYRLDSGNDSLDTLKAIIRDENGKKIPEQYLIIKRNLRKESKEDWLDYAKAHGAGKTSERAGKIVWTGKAQEKHPEGLDDVYCVYEVIERTTDHDNNPLLIHEIEVNTWWTNMRVKADMIIEQYHKHGTMEQFHSELKSDMGIERLPSSKFEVNKLYLLLGMNAYNVLRFIGQEAKKQAELIPVKTKSERMRIGKVLTNIINIAIKFVRHAGKSIIKIYEQNPWQKLFIKLDMVFQLL